MKKFGKTGIFIIVAGVILAFSMAIIVAVTSGGASPISNLWGTILSPAKHGLASVANWMGSIYGYFDEFDSIKTENENLKKQIAEMEQASRESVQANEENERLRKLLKLSEKRREFQMESAMIISRNASNWASTLEISRGQLHGIKQGMVAINEEGFLVGYIAEVGLNWALINTLVDTDTELGATVGQQATPAVAEGDFALMKRIRMKLTYLPRTTKMQKDDIVLTSGAGGVYPKGLVIGKVEQVRTEITGISEYAVVVPAVDLDTIQQVFIIKSFYINE